MDRTICKITGMHCAACSAAVEKTLNSLEGVTQASVSLASEEALITYDGGKITLTDMQAAVSKAGYSLIVASSSDNDQPTKEEKKQRKFTWSGCG